MLELLDSYTWPTDGIPFAGLGLRMDELALRLGVAVRTWHVDGLGPARGLGFRSASGRVYLLQELEMAVRYHGAPGPEVHIDAADLASFGTEALVDDVVVTLGIARRDVVFVADESVQRSAATLVARCSALRPERGS
jgi:hypothetical protein